MNRIAAENLLPGTPSTEWDISGSGAASIQGFSTDISVNVGEAVSFKVQTDASAYRLDVYRMGFYAGVGARKVVTLAPLGPLPRAQPGPAHDAATGLLDYGTWEISAQWMVPSDAASGIYFVVLEREDGTPGRSHIFFVVRDDASTSDVLFQTSDTTWQAYNNFADACLYEYLTVSNRRAAKVSYNRPFVTRGVEEGANWVFNAEYPMVRWLERNGFDVSYCAGIDIDRRGENLLLHKVFLSVGHDEYWSGNQREQVERARGAGVHLAFLSGNEVFWKVRWENSIDGSDTPYRTMVCYKETTDGAKTDPSTEWTGTWRDTRFSPPSDGGRPENSLTGTIFCVEGFSDNRISVPYANGRLRFWRDTDVARDGPGTGSDLSLGTLGFEWDEDQDNGARPPGLMQLSASSVQTQYRMSDDNSLTFGPGTTEHHLTLYRHPSGALVFGAGTIQWSWALDDTHVDGLHFQGTTSTDARAEQAMVNLFADMGVQPDTLSPWLLLATQTTDVTPPTSVITTPADGAQVGQGVAVTFAGNAADEDGLVGGVEVSTDGGLSWHPAVGRETWSYAWGSTGNGLITVLSRAVDDSGNLETPGPGITVQVGQPSSLIAPGGPVLVIVNTSYIDNPFGRYLEEILRAEGLMLFSEIELGALIRKPDPAQFLSSFTLVLLAETRLLPEQQTLIRNYVSSGGNLIAMRPDAQLADLFGLEYLGFRPETLQQFLAIDTTTTAGTGLNAESMQFHGASDAYASVGASVLASFWKDVTTPGSAPAVTDFSAGGGRAVAFAYDLAKSVVLTRQGNPEWIDSKGDGVLVTPASVHDPTQIRAMDMFCRLDGRMWFAPERLPVPQADEQQRLLANVILDLVGRPSPRVWYLPGTHRRLIVNTGDSCYSSLRQRQTWFDEAASYGATGTLYLLEEHINGDTDALTEAGWRAAGHDTGVHVFADSPFFGDLAALRNAYAAASQDFQTRYSHVVRSARNHTVDWLGWVAPTTFEAEFSTELDLNYYHYWRMSQTQAFPMLAVPTDKQHAHGYFTGSGLPQRFCNEDGTLLPVFQLLTEWPDEFFADNSYTAAEVVQLIEDMLFAAQSGYFSAFVTNIHPTRFANPAEITGTWARILWEYAQQEGIPVWHAARFLDFTHARQSVRFDNQTWDGTTLQFDYVGPAAGDEVTVILPADGLLTVLVDDMPMTPMPETIGGRSMAFLTTVVTGSQVVATYA